MLRFAALGSGSSGNAAVVRVGDTCILLDCGFTIKETVRRLEQLGIAPDDLAAIVVTHEHGDHLRGVGPLSRKYNLPVWMTNGTWRVAKDKKIAKVTFFHAFESFLIGDIKLSPFPTPHDAAESCQFIFSSTSGAERLAVLTDLGCITSYIGEHLKSLDMLVLECNYDVHMLRNGPYPPSLQSRISGTYGHLGNEQAAAFMQDIDCASLQAVFLAHLSEKNNSPSAAFNTLSQAVPKAEHKIQVLAQASVSAWHQIE